LIHPSTVLGQESEWLIYNEFVLTTKNYIRNVTHIKPEWLLEIAPIYYDLATFPKGPVKTALERVVEKQKRKELIKGRR
jgi:pre-mRNA-splicing factor ATP-dependent RNA helicase DHX15/PRP43